MVEGAPNLYQKIRTGVKRNLNHVVELIDMEYAIKARTDASFEEAEEGLLEHLTSEGFHVVSETDVQGIHHHYDLEYPKFKILKVAGAETLGECPMASRALDIDPGMSVFLPPSVILYETEGETRVSAIRPTTLLALFHDGELRGIIQELEGVLWEALEVGLPGSEMISESPPLLPGANGRATIKKLLNPVLNLLDAEYSIDVSSDAPRAEIEESVRHALSMRGQKVLDELSYGDTTILLAVNPGQAHKLLAIEPDIAVFAPLSIGIYPEGDRTHVRAVRPSTLLIFFTNPAIQDILQELEVLFWNALTHGVPDGKLHSRQPPLPSGAGQRTTAAGLPGGLDSFKKYRPS